MLKWISTSCRSTLIRVPKAQQLAFLNTPHQFRVLTQSAEHNERFEELKQKHGSMLTWHGAPFDVVFSILNTGLRNMSHDKAGGMFHGNACGGRGGIYQSAAYMSTSMGYSGVHAHNPATVPAREDDLITPDKNGGGYGGISAIFLAECIDHDFTSKNEQIVVQPNDDHVVLRGLFIYTPPHVSPPGQTEINTINLQNAEVRARFHRFVDTR